MSMSMLRSTKAGPVRSLLLASALLVAVGGTAAGAASHDSGDHRAAATARASKAGGLTKGKVRKIADKQIAAAAPGLGVATARRATNIYSANVKAGTMLGSIPAGATSEKRQLGGYAVNFGHPYAGCTISAGLATSNSALAQIGSVSVRPSAASPSELYVDTFGPDGNRADQDIFVMMICPG